MWHLLLMLFIARTDQYVRDASFLRFCSNLGGKTTMQDVGNGVQTEGDKCVITWDFPAVDDKEAEEYCQTWNMYPTSNAVMLDNKPVCTYENVYECRPDYTLIRGYCYKIVTRGFVDYEEAKNICKQQEVPSVTPGKKLEVEILRLFDPDLIRMFNAYFSEKRLIFIQPDVDMFDSVDFEGDGEDYAIAFGMAMAFKVGPGSVIKLPIGRKAQAMCFYRAEETTLSFSFKARKLAPYYHSMNTDGGLTMWRTAGHYGVKKERDLDAASKICEKSMRAIVGPDNGDVWDATKINVQQLSNDMKKSAVMTFAPYIYCCFKASDLSSIFFGECPTSTGWSSFVVFRTHYHSFNKCSAYRYIHLDKYPTSVGYSPNVPLPITYLFYPEPINGQQIGQRSHAVDAPVFCNLRIQDRRRPRNCAEGWIKYHRQASDIVVCHKLFDTLVLFADPLFGEDTVEIRKVIAGHWYREQPGNSYGDEYCINTYAEGSRDKRLNDWGCKFGMRVACVKAATVD